MYFYPKKSDQQKAQSSIEYTLIVILVAAAVIVMGPYLIRSWNANMKGWEDSITDSYTEQLNANP